MVTTVAAGDAVGAGTRSRVLYSASRHNKNEEKGGRLWSRCTDGSPGDVATADLIYSRAAAAKPDGRAASR